MKYHILLIALCITALGCSPSSDEDKRLYNQFNDIEEKSQEETPKAKVLADKYNAIFVKPYSRGWSRKYTYELQSNFEGRKLIFEAKLVDIYIKENIYLLRFGDNFLSNTNFILSSTYDDVIEITKSKSKRLIVIVTIESIKPLLSHSVDSEPSTAAIDRIAYGQSYLVNGSLDDYIIEQNPNN